MTNRRKTHKPRRASKPTARAVQPWFDDDDLTRFAAGEHGRLHDLLGAHPETRDGRTGTRFAVWAPNAVAVSLIGSFNDWNTERHPLTPIEGAGIWSTFVPDIGPGVQYKFHIRSRQNDYAVDKTDPFAFHRQVPPETAAVVWDLDFEWQDSEWLERRAGGKTLEGPMTIYELHLGSWRRDPESPNDFSTTTRSATH